MRMSKEGLCELAAYEALILTPYLCAANVKTVGFGSTVSDIPDLPSWSWDKQISVEKALELYKRGLEKYENAVNAALKVDVTQAQFDVLVSITYNIGIAGMRNSTFIKLINARATNNIITNSIKQWNKGGGRVLKGLVNRREAECKLYITGDYKSGGMVPLVPVNSVHRPVYAKATKMNLMDYL